jgi:ABC-type multidrug transport system ATPase subunit
MNHILEADGIQLEFNGRKILSSVYIKCETGKITGLLGRNGQGKSCLMKIIHGSLKAEKSVRIDNISRNEAFKVPYLLKYLPQFNFIPRFLTLKRVFKDFDQNFESFCSRFPEFTLSYNTSIGTLSGGEIRVVSLYVILTSPALFVMLDEPFTHLNPIQIEKVKELLHEEKANKGLLLTDHMYKHITEVSDALYVLTNGKTHLAKSMEDIEALGYARL